jgi:hypothetical protein
LLRPGVLQLPLDRTLGIRLASDLILQLCTALLLVKQALSRQRDDAFSILEPIRGLASSQPCLPHLAAAMIRFREELGVRLLQRSNCPSIIHVFGKQRFELTDAPVGCAEFVCKHLLLCVTLL